MEKFLLKSLFVISLSAAPFILKRKNLLLYLVVFFSKCVLSTSLDSYFIKKGKISYPVRPLPKIFDTNILYDLMFFPLLSVVWVRWSYQSKPLELVIKSLIFTVPLAFGQYILEKKTKLFNWKSWTIFHTFLCCNITLFTVRGLVGLLKQVLPENQLTEVNIKKNNRSNLPEMIKINTATQPLKIKTRI
ncbi:MULTISPECIES: CBO0543 family protein [unclassified Paenibacillus]|uniref:CBO0543 family protein n=1 Tax=unclassified Paenibacillus TaxID=185978 RepID=UPI00070C71F9|nr:MULTISPECIES: CBO0543 family protein [unclassified Paenibacillus]KQX53887.1 hypothetical protein ASD40_34420 [Paenibacillus sp. Root444D2]KRE44242.1 hypothetical protein ASG85_32875 [Paenibacillus sp. Soil724D2]